MKFKGLFKKACLACTLGFASILGFTSLSAQDRINPDLALEKLIKGNSRYANDQTVCPDRHEEKRLALMSKQTPFAVIVGCSDSRVSPEIVFDQGIGDLFVVRLAGNVVGPIGLDSIDYALIYLKASLIVVLGHENCGAVSAVLEGKTKDIETVAKIIKKGIEKDDRKEAITLPEAIKSNVRAVVDRLKTSSVIEKYLQENKVKVIGGYYNLSNGKVEFLQ